MLAFYGAAAAAYMKLQCAPACYSCESLSFESRCPMPENLENIWAPGNGLNAMFEKITTDAYYKETYDINVLLQPGMKNNKFPDSPWVVVIDNFLTETECDTLIELGAAQGYEQSKDVGAKKFDGTYDSNLSAGRTSTNAWCLDACFENPVSKQVIHKIENITGIPDTHAEYLQLLKYEEGQFYGKKRVCACILQQRWAMKGVEGRLVSVAHVCFHPLKKHTTTTLTFTSSARKECEY